MMMRISRLLPLAALASAGLTGCQPDERADPQRASRPDDRQELIVGAGEDEFGLELNRHRLGI